MERKLFTCDNVNNHQRISNYLHQWFYWQSPRWVKHWALCWVDAWWVDRGGVDGGWAVVEGRGGWWPSVAVCLCAVNLTPQCYIYVHSAHPPLSHCPPLSHIHSWPPAWSGKSWRVSGGTLTLRLWPFATKTSQSGLLWNPGHVGFPSTLTGKGPLMENKTRCGCVCMESDKDFIVSLILTVQQVKKKVVVLSRVSCCNTDFGHKKLNDHYFTFYTTTSQSP